MYPLSAELIPYISVLELLLIVVAFICGGFCKGFFGLGVPLIAVPVIASVTNLHVAIIMIAIPSVVPNLYQVWKYRQSWNHQFPLGSLSIITVIGSGVGVYTLVNAEPKLLTQILGALLMIYLVSNLFSPFCLSASNAKLLTYPVGFFSGIAGGTTGVSAPLILIYLSSLKLTRATFMFSISVYFIALGSGQFFWLILSNLMTWEFVFLSALSLVPIVFGMWLGNRVGELVPPYKFNSILQFFLLGLAIKLILSP